MSCYQMRGEENLGRGARGKRILQTPHTSGVCVHLQPALVGGTAGDWVSTKADASIADIQSP